MRRCEKVEVEARSGSVGLCRQMEVEDGDAALSSDDVRSTSDKLFDEINGPGSSWTQVCLFPASAAGPLNPGHFIILAPLGARAFPPRGHGLKDPASDWV